MRKMAMALAAVAGLVMAQGAAAQTATAAANASITIPTLLTIDLSSAAVTFGTATMNDFNDGFIDSNSETVISTRGNVGHDITISSDAANMTHVEGEVTKPASDLEWALEGSGSFAGLTEASATVASGLTRGVHDTAARIVYRMLLDLEKDAPGTYNLALTFTAVAN